MKKLLLIITLFFISISAIADTPAQQKLLQHLQGFNTLKADFKQTLASVNARNSQKSIGKMYIKRPSEFRWEIQRPFNQVMVSNGKALWVYDRDLDQVSIRSMQQTIDSPASLLTGHAKQLINRYKIDAFIENKIEVFKLTPKNDDAMLKWLTMYFNGEKLVKMRLTDQFGQQSMIEFSNIKIDSKLDNYLFNLKFPKNVDVIDNRDEQSKS